MKQEWVWCLYIWAEMFNLQTLTTRKKFKNWLLSLWVREHFPFSSIGTARWEEFSQCYFQVSSEEPVYKEVSWISGGSCRMLLSWWGKEQLSGYQWEEAAKASSHKQPAIGGCTLAWLNWLILTAIGAPVVRCEWQIGNFSTVGSTMTRQANSEVCQMDVQGRRRSGSRDWNLRHHFPAHVQTPPFTIYPIPCFLCCQDLPVSGSHLPSLRPS